MASIGVLLVVGFIAGVAIGVLLGSKKFIGCLPLALIPIGAIACVDWWLDQQPRLTSTSGLLFVFVPIPPSAAALAGYGLVWLIRDWITTRNLD